MIKIRIVKKGCIMNIKSIVTVFVAIMLATSAQAEKGGKGHGKYKNKYKHEKYMESNDHDVIVINNSDRVLIRDYIADDYRRNCPPGLAKKHNGCLPPGQAKKRYVIGQPLMVGWEPVPTYIVQRLDPAPYGYRYVRVDQDVLLISEASKKVIDAVTLMSAVRR
jgi:hypothetical protein